MTSSDEGNSNKLIPPRRLMAIGLRPHDHDSADEMLDTLMEEHSGNWHSMGPDLKDDGVVLWRVTSIRDLVVRLRHIRPGTLDRLDLVGHAYPGHLALGTTPAGEHEFISNKPETLRRLAYLGTRIAEGGMLRLIGCRVAGDGPGLAAPLLQALADELGVVVQGVKSGVKLADFRPNLLDIDDWAWLTAKPSPRAATTTPRTESEPMDSAEIQPQRGYFWLEVEARRLDLETVTIKLLQTEKELARVPWTVADRFDPAFIWRSYYPNAGSGGGPIVCPPAEETQIPGQFVTVRGYLLINAALSGVVDEVAKLHSVGVDTPKWPKELGLA